MTKITGEVKPLLTARKTCDEFDTTFF